MNDQAIIPAATILLVRDGPTGLEVFMVVRHHQIDFASGALVFPGGKVDANDALVTDLCDGVDGVLPLFPPSQAAEALPATFLRLLKGWRRDRRRIARLS